MNTHIMISQSMAADRVAPLAAQQPWRPNFPLSLSDLCPSLWFASSQVPAQLLLALNGLKQSLEIACVVRGMPRIRCAQVYAYMRTYVHVCCERACFFFSFSLSRSLALSLSLSRARALSLSLSPSQFVTRPAFDHRLPNPSSPTILALTDTKAFVRLTLYTLDEDGRPVLDGPHEYLQQVALHPWASQAAHA